MPRSQAARRTNLDDLRIAAPCTASWDAMRGDDRVRFCEQCRLDVYNLSGMRRDEAERLVRARQAALQRLCVRFFQRRDGTVLTRNCPVGLRALRKQLLRAAGRAAGFALMLVAMLTGCRHRPAAKEPPPQRLGEVAGPVMAPAPEPIELMGDVCEPVMGRMAAPPDVRPQADPRR